MNKQTTRSKGVLLRFIKATLVVRLLPVLVLIFSFQTSQAGSAAWKPRPTSGDWNNVANWRPRTIPNGSSDIATFGVSNTTDVSLTADETEVNGIVFTPGASAFTITADYPNSLTFTGFGIKNNSGIAQNFVTTNASSPFGITFHNQATAGAQTIFTVSRDFGYMAFYDQASAATATFVMEGLEEFQDGAAILWFFQNSTAANGTFINTGTAGYEGQGGVTWFVDSSTAANGTITNKADTAEGGYFGAHTNFSDDSTAGDSIITNEGAGQTAYGGYTVFADNSTAGNATITCEGATAGDFAGSGLLKFYGTSSAENATLIANGGSNGGDGGLIQFNDTSVGGTARIELFGNSLLDLSNLTDDRLSIGSLEGDGVVFVGAHTLTIGTNNLSTEFSGVIEGSGTELGTVVKAGSGTFTVSGANTYGGYTSVIGGFLRVENQTDSATGSGPVVVSYSTLGGSGIIGGSVKLSTLGVLAPGSGATTLTVKKGLNFQGGSYTWRVKTTTPSADKVIARGALLGSASFTGIAVGNAALSPGTTFTAIDNTSHNAIIGRFSNLPDAGTIKIGNNTFQADYEGGDGNDLTLTVVP